MKEIFRGRGASLAAGVAVAALGVWAFALRLRFLLASPYPWGVDGYWYAVQARAILEEGHLAYASAPLVPWWVALVARVSDPILATKLVAAAGSALAVVPAYLLGRRVGGARAPGVLAAALVATASGSFYLATEFVKEGVGVTLALAFVAALAWGLERPGKARAAWPALLLVACVLTHKTSAGLALLLGLPPSLEAALRAGKRRLLLVAAAVLVVSIVIAGSLAPRRFLGPEDASLLSRLFRARAELSLPALVLPDGTRRLFQHEALLAALVALATAISASPRLRARFGGTAPPPLALGFVLFALVIAIPWLDVSHADGLAYRLRLLAFVPLAILAAWVARLLGAPLSTRWRPALSAGAALVLVLFRPVAAGGVVHTHPGLAMVVRSLAGVVPEGSLVVTPERRIAFMAVWYARVRAATRPPARLDQEHSWRLLPEHFVSPALAALLDAPPGGPALEPPPRELHYLRHGLVLVREDVFQVLLARLPEDARAFYVRWPTR